MKRAYAPPELVVYGRIEELTLGSGGNKWDITLNFNAQAIGVTIGAPGPNGTNTGDVCTRSACLTVNQAS
jgi:hypothetical protein